MPFRVIMREEDNEVKLFVRGLSANGLLRKARPGRFGKIGIESSTGHVESARHAAGAIGKFCRGQLAG